MTERSEEFRRDLASVLNRYSMENGSETPDFILADYLIECLRALDAAILRRRDWHANGTLERLAAETQLPTKGSNDE